MRLAFASFVISLMPVISFAQNVVVRGGEHGDFTRLVMKLPQNAEWSVVQTDERRVTLDVETQTISFDLSQAFSRIDRERIKQIVVQRNGVLEIELACDCAAEELLVDGSLLVIDIKSQNSDQVVADEPPSETTEQSTADHSNTNTENFIQTPEDRAELLEELAKISVDGSVRLGPRRSADPLLPRLPERVHSGADLSPSGEPVTEQAPENAPEIGSEIARDLALAATRGVLDPALLPRQSQRLSGSQGRAPNLPDGSPSELDGFLAQATQEFAGIRDGENSGRISIGQENCIPDNRLNLNEWVPDGARMLDLLTERRRSLYTEFDRLDRDAVASLAMAQVYYGFGAEARATLRLMSDDSDPVLWALTYLVDGEMKDPNLFSQQAECQSQAGFWGLLAFQDPSGSPDIDPKAMTRIWENLPESLREHLGLLLSERLTEAGYSQEAKNILLRLERTKGEETTGIALERAKINIQLGDSIAAEGDLKDLSEVNSPDTPDAILARINIYVKQDKNVPVRLIDLAQAYEKELSGTPISVDLWAAKIKARTVNGNFDDAFVGIDDRAGIPDPIVAETTQYVMKMVTSSSDDLAFMKAALSMQSRSSEFEFELSHQISSRLFNLGMKQAALEYLSSQPDTEQNRQSMILMAAILAETGSVVEADQILLELQGDDISELRADVREMMGDHQFAAEVFGEIGNASRADRAAWMAEAWNQISDESEEVYEAAGVFSSEQTLLDAQSLRLDDVRSLSNESERSIAAIEALLRETSLGQ